MSAAATSADGRHDGVDENPGGGALARGLQVVVQAAQLQGALDLAVHDLGADSPAAYQQALVHEGLDGLAHGGAGQAEPPGQLYLVAQQAAGGECSVLDRGFELLGQLEVERYRTAPVHAEFQRH